MIATEDQYGEYTIKQASLLIVANKGIIKLPKIKLLALPGSTIRIKLTGNLASYEQPDQFRPVEKSFMLNLSACEAGSLISKSGKC